MWSVRSPPTFRSCTSHFHPPQLLLRLQQAVRLYQHTMRPTQRLRSGGSKIPYPKHVWSPAGGWYAQPANWRANTAIIGVVIFGISMITWSISADREHRENMPDPKRFFPSRYWSREIIEHERAQKAASSADSS